MEGVVLWADHIQAIHSQRPILRSTKLLRQPEKKIMTDEILADEKINVCNMKGLIVHLGCMRAFVWD
jgi:hypothetical protein